jgi:hypothetical protein
MIKLTVAQLVNKLPIFSWNPKVHYCVPKRPPLVLIASSINPVNTIATCFPNMHFNIILSFTPTSLQPPGFPTKIFYAFLISCYVPLVSPVVSSTRASRLTRGEQYKVRSPHCAAPLSPCYFILLRFKYSRQRRV